MSFFLLLWHYMNILSHVEFFALSEVQYLSHNCCKKVLQETQLSDHKQELQDMTHFSLHCFSFCITKKILVQRTSIHYNDFIKPRSEFAPEMKRWKDKYCQSADSE